MIAIHKLAAALKERKGIEPGAVGTGRNDPPAPAPPPSPLRRARGPKGRRSARYSASQHTLVLLESQLFTAKQRAEKAESDLGVRMPRRIKELEAKLSRAYQRADKAEAALRNRAGAVEAARRFDEEWQNVRRELTRLLNEHPTPGVISIRAAAKAIGVNSASVHNWFYGVYRPDKKNFDLIAAWVQGHRDRMNEELRDRAKEESE